MRIGAMNQRITLQYPVRVADGMGGFTETYQDEVKVWAAVWPVTAKEIVQAGGVSMEITHRIRIRYYPGVASTMRINHDGKYFNIVSIINPVTGNQWLDLMCKEAA